MPEPHVWTADTESMQWITVSSSYGETLMTCFKGVAITLRCHYIKTLIILSWRARSILKDFRIKLFFFFRILFCCVIRFWSLYLIFFLFYKKTQLLKNMLKNRIIHPFAFYNLFVFNACMFSFFGIRYIFQWIFSKGFQTSMHKINLNPTSQKVSEVPSVLVWDIELL